MDWISHNILLVIDVNQTYYSLISLSSFAWKYALILCFRISRRAFIAFLCFQYVWFSSFRKASQFLARHSWRFICFTVRYLLWCQQNAHGFSVTAPYIHRKVRFSLSFKHLHLQPFFDFLQSNFHSGQAPPYKCPCCEHTNKRKKYGSYFTHDIDYGFHHTLPISHSKFLRSDS